MTYTITPAPPDPRDIDADTPQEAAVESVRTYVELLVALVGYAERVEALVRNSAWQDALDMPEVMADEDTADPYVYSELSQEAALIARSNGGLGVAVKLSRELLDLLETPRMQR